VSTGWLWLLLAYVGLLAWALRQKHRFVEGPWWFHLRAFLPNWKFYHAVGWMPRLMVRHRQAAMSPAQTLNPAPSAWIMVYPRRQRRIWHLLHNADTNLALAHQNLVDHLANDIATLPDEGRIEALPIYHLVLRHAAWHLIDQGISPGTRGSQTQMQMELRLIHQTREQTEVVLCSPWVDLASVLAPESLNGQHG
jgi:hypothetical protein